MKRLIICTLLLTGLAACSEKDLRQAVELVTASVEQVPLTEREVAAALRDSLSRGISRGAISAAAENGYLGNPRLKIEFPQEVSDVEKALRNIGLGNEVDRFVRQLNRSAELAAARAKPIFIKAITDMSIGDAFDILNGGNNAATRYLRRTTGDDLYDAFLPVVRDALERARHALLEALPSGHEPVRGAVLRARPAVRQVGRQDQLRLDQ